MNTLLLEPPFWKEYELIDSGDQEKLERFGHYIFIRPEPKALWKKSAQLSLWAKAAAVYKRASTGGGQWQYKTRIQPFILHWQNLRFRIAPTGFKHLGIFPEQAALWQWTNERCKAAGRQLNILNLFAYTGGSTLASLSAGAKVTHLDAAKDIVTWARENATLSQLDTKPVRWIVDDAVKFLKREVKRGVRYDAIIMDPPSFGRGTSGQVWKIEDDLASFLALCKEVLSEKPEFIILNAYGVDFTSVVLHNMIAQMMASYSGKTEAGELVIPQSSNGFLLSTGIFGRWGKV